MSQPQSSSSTSAAQTYEDSQVIERFGPWAEDLLDRAKPQPGEHVLDIACGTGIVARKAFNRMHHDGQVTGLDINPAMIAVARASAAKEGVEIEWHVGSADELPFAGAVFDLVTVQQGLQFFPDREAAAREMFRVLRPGGRVATATWADITTQPVSKIFADAVFQHLGSAALSSPYSLADRDELHAIFAGAGFVDIEIERVERLTRSPFTDKYVDLRIASFTASMRALQAIGAEERQAMIEAVRSDVTDLLQKFIEGDEIVSPTEAHIAIARKPR